MGPVRSIAAAALIATSPVPASAATHALLVGVDEYRDAPLAGAVNDAKGLADALQAAGAADVSLVTDAEASLAKLRTELDGLVQRSSRGDLVVIGFAGHGAREPWGADHPPDVSEGDLHEVFLLQDYRPLPASGPATPERLAQFADRFSGREMQGWLGKLAAKGARVLFVADTCHGGGLTREPFDPHARRFASRGPIGPSPDLPAASAPDPKAFAHFQSLPGVTFLGATNAAFRVDEIAVGDDPEVIRGALSYALAQGLSGLADSDGDGKVTRRELYQYLRTKIRGLTDDRQSPELQPSAIVPGYDPDAVVLDLSKDLPKASRERAMSMLFEPSPSNVSAPVWSRSRSDVVRIAVVGEDAPHDLGASGAKVEIVSDPQKADVVFHSRAGLATTAAGDLLASEISVADLPGVVGREAALRRLARLAEAYPWGLRIVGGARVLRAGGVVTLDARPDDPRDDGERHALLLAISGAGEINLVEPTDGGDETLSADETFDPLTVGPPYGADVAIAIVSARPLAPLARSLLAINGRRAAPEAVALIEKAAAGQRIGVGLAGIYTAP